MDFLEKASEKLTKVIGTPTSIVIHTLFFAGIFFLANFGFSVDNILLILTTVVSLEAIYLSIFIQMSVNRTSTHIADVKEDISDIQEDVEGIQEDVDDLEVNIDDIQEDVEGLETNVKVISDDNGDNNDDELTLALANIEKHLKIIQEDIAHLKKKS